MNRPSLGKAVSVWPEAEFWERLYMDLGYDKDQGKILVVVDAGSGWIERFPAGNRTSETVKAYLSQIIARFGKPKNLAWCPNLKGSFGALLQMKLMTHRNTSQTRSKTPVELLLGRRVRLPAIADFDLCEPILFKANEKKKTVSATIIIRKDLNTSFIQPKNSTRTVLVSDNQIAPNCETTRRQCEDRTSSGGDHISIRTTTSDQRRGTLTSRWSFCSHISCRAPTTQTIRFYTNINKKQKTTQQIWRTCTHKLALKKREDVMVSKKHHET